MRVGRLRIDRDRAVETCQRIVMALEIGEEIAAIGVRLGEIRLERKGAVQAFQCLLPAGPAVASAVPRLLCATADLRIQRQRPVMGFQRFGQPLQARQRRAAIVVRDGGIGIERDRPVMRFQRVLRAPSMASAVPRPHARWQGRDRARWRDQSFPVPPGRAEADQHVAALVMRIRIFRIEGDGAVVILQRVFMPAHVGQHARRDC